MFELSSECKRGGEALGAKETARATMNFLGTVRELAIRAGWSPMKRGREASGPEEEGLC